MDTGFIILIVILLICTHCIAYHFGALKAYDKVDVELVKIKDELSGLSKEVKE